MTGPVGAIIRVGEPRSPGRNILVRSPSELPDLTDARDIYLDFETTSGRTDEYGTFPHLGARACGAAITYDGCPDRWYIPIRHKSGGTLYSTAPNIELPVYQAWLKDTLSPGARGRKRWINHNLKFDARFADVDGVDPCLADLVDTLPLCKLIDGQASKSGYDLDTQGLRLLGRGKNQAEMLAELDLLGKACRDFGELSPEVAGDYACGDVDVNRGIWHEIQRRRYEGDSKVWYLEIAATRAIYRAERRGMRIDLEKLDQYRRESQGASARIESKWRGSSRFRSTEMGSHDSLARLFLETLKLPVVAWTDPEEGKDPGPSFGYDAMVAYQEHPLVKDDAELVAFCKDLVTFREHNQFVGLYAKGWMKHVDPKGFIYPTFNQIVRTGRMSAKDPNPQQLNTRAKELVIPDGAGMAWLSRDYSQIEYRVIASICRELELINAYRLNPRADFHQVVADICGIERGHGKTVNFGIAFGMGHGGLARQLARALGGSDAQARSESILQTYHGRFSRIKKTGYHARHLVEERGFIKTLYGRRRAIPHDFARIAFSTAVQGTAADLFKEGLVKLDREPELEARGVGARAYVHDENLLQGPTDSIRDPSTWKIVDEVMTTPSIDLGLPLTVEGWWSEESWAKAGKPPKKAA